jgi:pimeloyl-ACP methyl ester carboxylesterase
LDPANRPKAIILEDTGHWLIEERPRETMDALMSFL